MNRADYDHLAAQLDGEISPGAVEAAHSFDLDGVHLVNGADLKPEPIAWLWKHWLALGKLHILAGAPGQGKTTIAIGLAATVTIGGHWPDGMRCQPSNVLIWSGEDDPADTLLPRLIAVGGDPKRCYFVASSRIDGEPVPFDPARDFVQLTEAIERIGGVSLLIVDPVVSAVTGDSHKNAEVRRSLQPLVDLGAACRCAVLGITHFSKGGQGQDPTQRVIGSVAFSAVARIVLVAAKVKGEDGEPARVLARSKSNIGPDDGGFRYFLEQTEALPGIEASRIAWGEAVQGTARELLTDPDAEDDGEQGAKESAEEFLRELLGGDTVPAKQVKADCLEAGYAWRTIQRAADGMSVIRKKGGMGDGWYWRLPKMPKPAEDAEGAKDANVESLAPSASSGALASSDGSVEPAPAPDQPVDDDAEVFE
ncbi:MAG TPA: AAA family ATPase [Rhodoferax sp.]|nr:AAA family ATPase [Rhodoferax sp.]